MCLTAVATTTYSADKGYVTQALGCILAAVGIGITTIEEAVKLAGRLQAARSSKDVLRHDCEPENHKVAVNETHGLT